MVVALSDIVVGRRFPDQFGFLIYKSILKLNYDEPF